jgi:hypothetical protein
MSNIIITSDETVDLNYAISNDLTEIEHVLNVVQNGSNKDLNDLGIRNISAFTFSPKDSDGIGEKYIFDVNGESKDLTVEVIDIPTNGIWYLPLTESSGSTTKDIINGNSGTLGGTSSWASGLVGNYSVNFTDSENDFVSIGNLDTSDLSEWTISAWAYPVKGASQTWTGILHSSDADINGWGLNHHTGQDEWRLTIQSDYTNSGLGDFSHPVLYDEWQLVTITNKNSTLKLYINGEEKSSTSGSYDLDLSNVNIGKYIWKGESRHYKGKIDASFISNSALSQTEIMNWYNKI